MIDDESKYKILMYTLKGIIHRGIIYYQLTLLEDFSYLIHIVLADGEGIYGLLDPYDALHVLDAWEWQELGGLTTFTRALRIEPVKVSE